MTLLDGAKRLQVAYYRKKLGPWRSRIPAWEDLVGQEQEEFLLVARAFNDGEALYGTDTERVIKHAAEVLQRLKPELVDMELFERYFEERYKEYTGGKE